ncbi:MAG TPA: LLM class flavin-dependent oxidoreductase [bacterium]|nr:LLM class flavin-dependent oxidoreductase [bacterium]
MKLSIVDQSPVPVGATPADALRNTIDLARLADRLGYERYWIAEHHATPGFASPAPEVLIARVGGETTGIRIGSGGVLLPHYSPLKVAETFRVLHALYPGRIDLGIGRAPGSNPLEAYALRRNRDRHPLTDDFPEQLVELLAFLRHAFPPGHPFGQIKVSPEMPGDPEVWLLGSSMWSATAAAQLGLPYAFAHFINPEPTRAAIEYYHSHVTAAGVSAPRTILALGVVCADTETEARRLHASVRLRHVLRELGIDPGPIPTPEEALARLGAGATRASPNEGEWPRYIVGAPEQVHAQLVRMATELRVEELMVVTVVHDHEARRRSHLLLAEIFGLASRAQGTPHVR